MAFFYRRREIICSASNSFKSLEPCPIMTQTPFQAAILQQTAEYIYSLEQEKTRLLAQNCHLKRLLSLSQQQAATASPAQSSSSSVTVTTEIPVVEAAVAALEPVAVEKKRRRMSGSAAAAATTVVPEVAKQEVIIETTTAAAPQATVLTRPKVKQEGEAASVVVAIQQPQVVDQAEVRNVLNEWQEGLVLTEKEFSVEARA